MNNRLCALIILDRSKIESESNFQEVKRFFFSEWVARISNVYIDFDLDSQNWQLQFKFARFIT